MSENKKSLCNIVLESKAEKSFKEIPDNNAERVKKKIEELAKNPICERRLKGKLEGLCRLRVGKYRVIYLLKPCTIYVLRIGIRESIYEELT